MTQLGEYFTEDPTGVGEYFTESGGAAPVQGLGAPPEYAVQPQQPYAAQAGMGEVEPFEASAGLGSIVPYPQYASANGMGQGNGTAWKLAASVSPVAGGLGQIADAVSAKRNGAASTAATAAVATAVVVGLAARFALGYAAGKAMAPSAESEARYAWGGALAGTFLGTFGLGVEGLIALNARQ